MQHKVKKKSNLNGEKYMLDIYTDMDWVRCWEQKDVTLMEIKLQWAEYKRSTIFELLQLNFSLLLNFFCFAFQSVFEFSPL